MSDPVVVHVTTHYQIYATLLFAGGIIAVVRANVKSISSLWGSVNGLEKLKTDKSACDKHQLAVQVGFREIKEILEINRAEHRKDMEELRTDRRNLEQNLMDHIKADAR